MITQAPAGANDAGQADPGEVQPVAHETADRIATGTITALPFIALGIVCWQVWSDLLRWSDVAVFVIMYVLTGLGVTVGFHRHLTHRSFKTSRPLRGLLAILGSVAIEGPVISWVADHRKHHTYSDQEGDPAQPARRPRRRPARRAQGPRPRARRLALHPHPSRRAEALRARPDRRSGHLVRRPDLPGLGARRVRGRVRAGLRDRRHARRRADRSPMGRRRADARRAPRHLQHQLAVPLLRASALPDRRRVAQPVLAGAADVRRELAQQPPRLPDFGVARDAPLGDRPVGARDQRPGEAGPGLGRGAGSTRSARRARPKRPPRTTTAGGLPPAALLRRTSV